MPQSDAAARSPSSSTPVDDDQPPFPVDREVLAVLGTLWSAGYGGYLVGGGVRDAMLGLPVRDWDIATEARPERILRIFPGSSYHNRFGTVLARGLEITTFRRDHRYADHRRPDTITFSGDIFEDLARRDLTINAMAWGRRGPDAAARLVDPADGQGDLTARLVRAVGDPNRRFDEDALRLLRAVRIAARLDFAIEPMTRQAMVAHASDMEWVSEERIGSEVRRMLTAEVPSRAIRLMHDTGILATAIPELAALPAPALERALAVTDATASSEPGGVRRAWPAPSPVRSLAPSAWRWPRCWASWSPLPPMTCWHGCAWLAARPRPSPRWWGLPPSATTRTGAMPTCGATWVACRPSCSMTCSPCAARVRPPSRRPSAPRPPRESPSWPNAWLGSARRGAHSRSGTWPSTGAT